jgi:hypothetical protein
LLCRQARPPTQWLPRHAARHLLTGVPNATCKRRASTPTLTDLSTTPAHKQVTENLCSLCSEVVLAPCSVVFLLVHDSADLTCCCSQRERARYMNENHIYGGIGCFLGYGTGQEASSFNMQPRQKSGVPQSGHFQTPTRSLHVPTSFWSALHDSTRQFGYLPAKGWNEI